MRTLVLTSTLPAGCDLLLLPVPARARGVPAALAALVRPLLRRKDLERRAGSAATLYPGRRGSPARIVAVSLGDGTVPDARRCGGVLARELVEVKAVRVPAVVLPRRLSRDSAQALLEGLMLGQWRLKVTKEREPEGELPLVTREDLRAALRHATAIAGGILETRRLANAPAALVNPSSLEEEIRSLGALPGVTVEVWDAERMGRERLGCILAVGRGSAHAPRLAIVRMHAPLANRATVLVGKGVCFDAGGYNLKSTGGIEEMYDDMAGAATVLGALRVLARERRRIPVIALFPLVENLISGTSYKPGDILTARNGKTVEVTNTDAEGRLILADALALASEWKPRCIVDVATLTSAALAAIGDRFSALLTADEHLARELIASGDRTHEPFWRLPLHPDYARWVEGKRADLRNTSRVPGLAGASIGAEFLRNFVAEGIPYAHIDLAASMQHDAAPPDLDACNGWGVRALADFLART